MFIVVITCLLLVFGTTVIHYEALRLLNTFLPQLRIHNRLKLLVVMFSAFVAHAVEIAAYGSAFFFLVDVMAVGHVTGGAVFSPMTCMYFSAENFTSLGFGDLTPIGPVRLLAGVEALNGLLLIAWTASFTYLSMQKFWSPEAELDSH
ncbi:MAG: ion channel [Spongiibacteraceae bacterium]